MPLCMEYLNSCFIWEDWLLVDKRWISSSITRTVARKFSPGQFCACVGGLTFYKLTKIPLIYSAHVSIWGLVGLFLGAKPTKAPSWRRDWEDCGQKSNNLQIILFFPTSFYARVQLRLLLERVFVAVKKWESCIYFQRNLQLCAVSCIYGHIWLRKTWHNPFSFARTWPKAKIFRTSTSNWVRALSYLSGVVKRLACKHWGAANPSHSSFSCNQRE